MTRNLRSAAARGPTSPDSRSTAPPSATTIRRDPLLCIPPIFMSVPAPIARNCRTPNRPRDPNPGAFFRHPSASSSPASCRSMTGVHQPELCTAWARKTIRGAASPRRDRLDLARSALRHPPPPVRSPCAALKRADRCSATSHPVRNRIAPAKCLSTKLWDRMDVNTDRESLSDEPWSESSFASVSEARKSPIMRHGSWKCSGGKRELPNMRRDRGALPRS